jgi:hypothetical protein
MFQKNSATASGTPTGTGSPTQPPKKFFGMTGKKSGITMDFSGDKASILANRDTVRSQDQQGCWTLDASPNWQKAFKDGNSCSIGSISLPDDVKATTYTAWTNWNNICHQYGKIEDIPAGTQNHIPATFSDGTPACAILFSAA